MKKAEFLQELRETLAGEVSAAVIQENVAYYDSYISEQTASGRLEEEVLDEIGSPRLIARTIIDSQEAAEGTDSIWREAGNRDRAGNAEYAGGSFTSYGQNREPKVHYIDFGKWYWKLLGWLVLLLAVVLGFALLSGVFTIVTGTVFLVIRFAGPLLVLWLIYLLIRGPRR